jgi:hypothetical protein
MIGEKTVWPAAYRCAGRSEQEGDDMTWRQIVTWRKMIDVAIERNGLGKLIACTLSEEELDVEFDRAFGAAEGAPFTAWTELYVLFPVEYDGAEGVGYAPRNPCGQATEHQ